MEVKQKMDGLFNIQSICKNRIGIMVLQGTSPRRCSSEAHKLLIVYLPTHIELLSICKTLTKL